MSDDVKQKVYAELVNLIAICDEHQGDSLFDEIRLEMFNALSALDRALTQLREGE